MQLKCNLPKIQISLIMSICTMSTLHCISVMFTNYNYSITPQCFDVTFYLLIVHISMIQLQCNCILVVLRIQLQGNVDLADKKYSSQFNYVSIMHNVNFPKINKLINEKIKQVDFRFQKYLFPNTLQFQTCIDLSFVKDQQHRQHIDGKNELIYQKLSSISMKTLNDITCNLN